jgi:hypothetical protein
MSTQIVRLPGETSETLLCVLNAEGFRCEVWQYFPSKRVAFIADGDIDADGAYRAYHKDSGRGLDKLANAGHPGNWWGIVTHNQREDGQPIVQGQHDPAPGYYISSTSYQRPQFGPFNPRRYLDAETVPFIVVENYIRRRAKGVVLGCKARVTNLENNRSVDCVVGDLGPLTKLGELSIAAANAIGMDGNPRTGGEDQPILRYELWPDVPAVVNGEQFQLIWATPERTAA